MYLRNPIHRTAWLAILALSVGGGWIFGRVVISPGRSGAEDKSSGKVASQSAGPAFTWNSPQGQWMERVKKAAPRDFPLLLEQWKTAFPLGWNDLKSDPTDWNDLQGRPETTLRWLLSLWLAKDPEGFLEMAKTPGFEHAGRAAQVYARMMPEQAAKLLFGPGHGGLDQDFVMKGAWELTESHPMIYLEMDPRGTIDLIDGMMRTAHWENAIENLAKTDPVAAARICLDADLDEFPLGNALQSIAKVWKSDDPSMLDWLNGIADLKIRELANNSRLTVMAEKDPDAVLAEMYVDKHDYGTISSLEATVLRELTRADPIKAFKFLKDMEALFSKQMSSSGQELSGADGAEIVKNPFNLFAPEAGSKVEANRVRGIIISQAESSLPDEAGFFDFFSRLRQEMGGDSEWLREIEVDLIRQKTTDLSSEACLTMTGLWVDKLKGAPDDETFGYLAARAADLNPELVLASLDRLPEAVRPSFAGEAIKHLPDAEVARNATLLGHLTAREWDEGLGEVLGRNAAAYADVIASLPSATTLQARESFTKKWGDADPEAAARWVGALPDDAAAKPAVRGLVDSWVEYDRDAAMSWASTLPAGPGRDVAAAGISESLARRYPDEAFEWAGSLSDLVARDEALNKLDRLLEGYALEEAKGNSRRMLRQPARPKPGNPPIFDPSDPFGPQ